VGFVRWVNHPVRATVSRDCPSLGRRDKEGKRRLETDLLHREIKLHGTGFQDCEHLLISKDLGFDVGKFFGIGEILSFGQFVHVLVNGDENILNEFNIMLLSRD
jgi:hypothetical protein